MVLDLFKVAVTKRSTDNVYIVKYVGEGEEEGTKEGERRKSGREKNRAN